MILCSEKCFHEEDGLCVLKEVTHPSSTPIKDCPYFKEKTERIAKKEAPLEYQGTQM